MRKSYYQNDGLPKIFGGNAIWNKYVFNFFWKIAIVSDVFKVMGSSFQTLGAATEKACLLKLNFVLGTISCCEIDGKSCLWIFERCRRLAIYMSYMNKSFLVNTTIEITYSMYS